MVEIFYQVVKCVLILDPIVAFANLEAFPKKTKFLVPPSAKKEHCSEIYSKFVDVVSQIQGDLNTSFWRDVTVCDPNLNYC